MRSKKQIEALEKQKDKVKKETGTALRQALDRLVRKKAVKTDGRLTYANLYIEAGVSRTTLERYPEYKDELDKAKNFSGKDKHSPDNVYDKNKELLEINKSLLKELNTERKSYENFKKISKQEVMLLNNKIASLEKMLKREVKNGKSRLKVVK